MSCQLSCLTSFKNTNSSPSLRWMQASSREISLGAASLAEPQPARPPNPQTLLPSHGYVTMTHYDAECMQIGSNCFHGISAMQLIEVAFFEACFHHGHVQSCSAQKRSHFSPSSNDGPRTIDVHHQRVLYPTMRVWQSTLLMALLRPRYGLVIASLRPR